MFFSRCKSSLRASVSGGLLHVRFVALPDIFQEDELLYDYNGVGLEWRVKNQRLLFFNFFLVVEFTVQQRSLFQGYQTKDSGRQVLASVSGRKLIEQKESFPAWVKTLVTLV